MSSKTTILKNASSNLAGYFVNLTVGLLLSPFVVHALGDSLFGLWTLIRSMTGYYGIFDLGIFSAVSHYVTRYVTKNNIDGVNRTMSTAIVILCVVALCTILLTIVLTYLSPTWFSIEGTHSYDLQLALLLTGVTVSLNFPLLLFKAIPYSLQRLELLNIIGVSTKLFEAGLTVFALNAGYGILGITIVYLSSSILGWVAHIYLAYRFYPNLKISIKYFTKDSLNEIFGYGIWSTIITTAEKTVFFADSIVIGFFLTVEAITFYAIGANLVPYYLALIQSITWAITPFATAQNTQGNQQALKQVLLSGTRGTVAIGAIIGGGIIFLGQDFLSLWMGGKYVSGETYTSSATILSILTIATFFRITQSCGFQILYGMGRVKYLAFMAIAEVTLNFILSIILLQYYGIIGVAYGTLIPTLLIRGILQPLYLIKITEIPIKAYYSKILIAFCPIFGIMLIINEAISHSYPVTSWTDLIIHGLILTIPAMLTAYFCGISQEDRKNILGFLYEKRLAFRQ